RAGSLVLAAGYGFNLWNFSTAAFGLGFLYLSALLLILLYLLIFQKLRFTFQVGSILKKWQKKLLDFGIYSMIMAGSFAVMNNISYDQITSIIGSDAMGIFNTCFFIAVIVEMPRRNMAKVVTPLLSTEFEKKNMVEVRQLYQRSSITMATIGSLIVIGIISNLGDLFLFIPKGTSFQTGSWVVVTVCLAKLSLMVSSFPAEVINYSKYYRLNVIFQVSGMLILIVSNTLLIPKIGINGAAISYLICIIAQVISRLLFVYSKFKLSPFNKKHLVLLSIFLLVGALAMLFKLPFHPMLNIAIRAFLTIILFTILVVKLQVSSDINRLIRATFDILQKTIK
ncbi:MAG: polysaccharide biosynthesis C-terminal domain-containing protein, partial [Bacteroidota bacterium]